MKRMLLLPAALLVCASACTPATNENTNSNANINANMSNMNASNMNTSSAIASDSDLIAKEKEVYDDIKKKDSTAFGALLADDFMYVTSDGVHDKAATVKEIGMNDLTDIALTDFKVIRIDKDAAVVIYNSDSKGTSQGKPMASKSRESSVWVNHGGKWVAIFHQDCDIRPMMTPPPAAASANSNTSANSNKAATAASPATAAMPGTDVEANEKMVWDAIKRKDASGFASFLADDALEVEPDKVYTKAESASTVTSLPFLASVALSDFKTVKIDNDASIVIYTAKGTGPDKKPFTEHHSTVWANHGGKWLATLHHGTPVAPPAPPGK